MESSRNFIGNTTRMRRRSTTTSEVRKLNRRRRRRRVPTPQDQKASAGSRTAMSSSSSSSFGVTLLLLASMHQHRDGGGGSRFAAAINEGEGGGGAFVVDDDHGRRSADRWPPMQQLQQQPLLHHQQRQLAPNPFLPDYTTRTCKNDQPATSEWQAATSPKSASECCQMYFSWNLDECESLTGDWVMKNMMNNLANGSVSSNSNGGGSNGSGGEKVQYYPDSTSGICHYADELKPSWIQTLEDTYDDCCIKHLGWSLDKCLAARPVVESNSGGVGGDNGNGGDKDLGSSLSGRGEIIVVAANGKKTNPPTPSPKRPTGSSSSAMNSSNSKVVVDCDGLKRNDCIKMEGCGWERRIGCAVATSQPAVTGVSNGSNIQGSTGSSTTTNGSSNSNTSPASPSVVVDCTTAKSETQCLSNSNNQCRWRSKKKVCAPTTTMQQQQSQPNSAPAASPSSSSNTSSNTANNNEEAHPQQDWYYYYDTSDGKCKPDGPTRPSWLTSIFPTPKECCEVSWDSILCMASLPKESSNVNSDGNGGGDDATNDANNDGGGGSEYDKVSWYYDTGDGMCKLNTPTKPSWLNTIFHDLTECCGLSYNSEGCLRKHASYLNGLSDANGDGEDDGQEYDSEAWDPSTPYVLIDLTTYGTLQLTLDSLPSQASPEWNTLKRVLTKTLLLTIVGGCDKWVHGNMNELELWYIGGESFTWRHRRRGLQEHEEENEDEEEVSVSSSALRGKQATVIPPNQGQRRTSASSTYELKWEMLIPAKCNTYCQQSSNTKGSHIGSQSPFEQINTCFANIVTSGNFATLLKNFGMNMGLFHKNDEPPAARDGVLTYRYATQSALQDVTWQPSPTPTYTPTYITDAPTIDVYYADSINNLCTTFDNSFGFNTNKFGSIEECCKFPWMGDYNVCMDKSLRASVMAEATERPTKRPTPRPSRRRTPRPTPRRSVPQDVVVRPPWESPPSPPSGPTRPPPSGQSGPSRPTGPNTTPAAVVYYPDLTLGVCKFDGLHGNNPYQFLTAQECCTNQWMDFDKCMAYANPYYSSANAPKYYPDVYEGYCKSDGGHVGLDARLIFGSLEKCCDNIWMDEVECLVKSKNPPTSSGSGSGSGSQQWGPNPPPFAITGTPPPTRRPTRHPTRPPIDPAKVTGTFYPDFDEGLCLSDGNHDGHPYTFETLALCCTNAIMNFEDCVLYSMDLYYGPNDSDAHSSAGGGDSQGDFSSCFWYPDPTAFGTCTYSSLYPDDWSGNSNYLFDTQMECCETSFGSPRCSQTFNCGGSTSGFTSDGTLVSATPTTAFPTWQPTAELRPDVKPKGGPAPSSFTPPSFSPPSFTPPSFTPPNPPPSFTPPSPNSPSSPTRLTPKPTLKNNGLSSGTSPSLTPKPTINPRYTKRPTKSPVEYVAPEEVTLSIDATAIIEEIFDGFEDGISGTFPWSTTEDLPWSLNSEDKTEGEYSAVSHKIEPGERSDLYVSIKSSYGGTLYFDFKSDVKMPYSGCYINLDGESKVGYTFPKEDWIEKTLSIPKGEHVVMFRAWAPDLGTAAIPADVSSTIGLDNVSFMPNLHEGFEGGKLEWGDKLKFEGEGFWKFDWGVRHEGSVSLRSPTSLKAGQSTHLSFTVTAPRRGATLNFWYFSQVEKPFDSFNFKVNDETLLTESKVSDEWQQFTKNLPPGTHELTWEYSKQSDSGTHPGKGSVWIDDISIAGKS